MEKWLQQNWGWLAGFGAGMVGILKYLFSHNSKHKEIDERLEGVEEHFKEHQSLSKDTERKNDQAHKEISHEIGVLRNTTFEIAKGVSRLEGKLNHE